MPAFPKPQTIRSQRTIDEIRRAAETCEVPSCSRRPSEVHHIRSKGSGGPDIRENLIALCSEHHRDAQEYRIPQVDLFRITAAREGIPLAQVYQVVGLALPGDAERDTPPPPVTEMDPAENSWEIDVSVFVQIQQDEESSNWKKAEHAARMLQKYGRGTASKLASEVGVSASYIRGLAAMAKAFPEDQRDMGLSLSHHMAAAQTETPQTWLDRAVAQELSVRELRRAIREQRDLVDEEGRYRASVERVEQAVRKFNEAWETRRNIKASLVWEDAGFRTVRVAG